MTMRDTMKNWSRLGGWMALLAMLAPMPTGAAARVEYAPVSTPATHEHHVGKVVWLDLVTNDLEAAKGFYSGVFGWTFESRPGAGDRYALALLDGSPVGGIFRREPPPGERRQAAWLTFFSVADVDRTVRDAVAGGARVLYEPRNVTARGRQAVLADPEGAAFAVIASSSGDPPDLLAPPGDWIWTSLLVHDPDRDVEFYQSILGYEAFDLEARDGSPSVILSSEEFARASVNTLPPGTTPAHPHWLNFIRVASVSDTAARVTAHGGTILVTPHLDRHGGSVAVVADPAGAPFGLLEWNDADGMVSPK